LPKNATRYGAADSLSGKPVFARQAWSLTRPNQHLKKLPNNKSRLGEASPENGPVTRHHNINSFESIFVEQFLSSVGITEPKEIIYNPSYEQLFEDEMQPGLEGYARGYLSELGAVNVLTGEYTGRSPKDKFIVMDDTTRDSLWWNGNGAKNDNKSNHPRSMGRA
jgi:hypothetical protein